MGKKDFCCAEGCSHERSRGDACTFHKFPKDPKLRALWLSKISRVTKIEKNGKTVTQPWKPSESSKLCSCHFDSPPPVKSRKKWFSVPSIFSHRQAKKKTPRRQLRERQTSEIKASEKKLVEEPRNADSEVESDTDDLLEIDMVETRGDSVPECQIIQHSQPSDHDYLETAMDELSCRMLQENPGLGDFVRNSLNSEKELKELNHKIESGQFLTYESAMKNNKLFQYYTGLRVEVFQALFHYLSSKAKVMKYPIGARTVLFKHHAEKDRKKPGPQRARSLEEEMFVTLVKLKLGLQSADCAFRFGMATSTFSSIFTAWITLLAQELEHICKMPPTTETDYDSAECFNPFPNVRIVVDCTELFAERPSSIGVHKQLHSSYKHHSTVKFLVGMNTGGAITYISNMFGGRASDKFITNESGDLLESLNPGEKVMADRGFTIQDDLPIGVQLIIPSFKHKDKSQFTKSELQTNKKISEARVHIERAIRRIKQFQILKTEMKLTQFDVYGSIFKACAYLVNFQDPFMKA